MVGRQRNELAADLSITVKIDEDSSFFLRRFTEGILEQAAGIAHFGTPHLLRSVKMSQCRILETVKRCAVNQIRTSNRKGAFGITAFATRSKYVTDADRPHAVAASGLECA